MINHCLQNYDLRRAQCVEYSTNYTFKSSTFSLKAVKIFTKFVLYPLQ